MRHSGFWIAPVLQEVQHGKAFDTPAALREALGRHAAHSGCRRGMHGASAPLSPGGHHPDRQRRTVGQCGEQHGACGVLGPGARTGTGGARRAANGQQYDFDYCYAQVAPFYAQQDINWINQETLCSDELEPSSYPCFSTPGDCARALYRAGIRVFSLSNNHTYDKGAAGLAATLRFWESMPEGVVTTGLWRGADDYSRIPLQTVNGVTIAYLSYTEHTNGIPTSSSMPANVIYTSQTDVIEQQVRAAHQQADFVIVGVHWGVEDSHTIVDGQRTLAQQLADWGADVIVGTHPHVLQDAQWLSAADGRQTFVAYSLGNFLSTQNRPDQLVGAILNLQLQKTTEPDGTVQCAVLEPKLLPTVTHYDAGKSNVRTYLFRDYTQELAKQHGVRAKHSDFSLDTVQKIAQNNISSDFLELT